MEAPGTGLPLNCPSCGYVSPDTATFCTNCGTRLGEAAAPAPTPQPTYPTAADFERQQGAQRTSTGLLLLLIGFALAAVPLISVVGSLIILVAVIMMLMGSRAFGAVHRNYVIWSIVSWILVVVGMGIVLGLIIFQFAVASITGNTADLPRIWPYFVIALGVGSAALGIPYLLITFKLQDQRGQQFLWVAFVVQVGAAVGLALYFNRFYGLFYDLLVTGSPGTVPFTGLGLESLYGLANLVWVLPYYMAYKRVHEGQIPASGGS